jgi:hypothetical protein
MSLFEWIGERFNPGPIGTIKRNEDQSWQPKNKVVSWILTLLGIGLFGIFSWAILQWEKPWLGFLLLAVYLLLARLLSPKPDTRNVGWFGGLVDHPFRISDDFNRWLLFFAVFLLPGKVVLYAFQTLVNTFRLL